MLVKIALENVGGLSRPSKMPGKGYGLPASACKAGAKFAQIPGSVCAICYAKKGRYSMVNCATAQAKRLASLTADNWAESMAVSIQNQLWFRWHDSGDLQNREHLDQILAVVQATPTIQHWLPTHETGLVRSWEREHATPLYRAYPNLVVRLSAAMINGKLPVYHHVSSVHTFKGAPPAGTVECTAYRRGGHCGACRKCWNPAFPAISYPQH